MGCIGKAETQRRTQPSLADIPRLYHYKTTLNLICMSLCSDMFIRDVLRPFQDEFWMGCIGRIAFVRSIGVMLYRSYP